MSSGSDGAYCSAKGSLLIMLELGSLAFTNPWLLSALLALPAIYLLIRAIPPVPTKKIFPAIRLLRDFITADPPSSTTPWWLLLLRLLIATLLILALSDPLLNPNPALPGNRHVVLTIDNSWTAAPAWQKRQDAALTILKDLERDKRQVILLPSTPPAGGWRDGDERGWISPMTATQAMDALRQMAPQPWSADYHSLSDWVENNTIMADFGLLISDGLGHDGQERFLENLKRLGPVHLSATSNMTVAFRQVTLDGLDFNISMIRAHKDAEKTVTIEALSNNGRSLGTALASFNTGDTTAQAKLIIPPNLRADVAQLRIKEGQGAAALYLLDARAARPLVGILDTDTAELRQPLQSSRFYLTRAITPYSSVVEGDLSALLDQKISFLILGDSGRLSASDEDKILLWVREGGVLLRFAGPKMALASQSGEKDPLLPVTLRLGERAVGGALSWSEPQKLGAFPDDQPLAGLTPSAEITVSKQVLAQPELELASKTWARLEDNTPLITAKSEGLGRLILVHTTATPTWSDLTLSGTFVDILRRLLPLATQAVTTQPRANGLLRAEQHVDGQGNMISPYPGTENLDTANTGLKASARTPMGLYGADAYAQALNLAAINGPITPHFTFSDFAPAIESLPRRQIEDQMEQSLAPHLLTLALILIIIDGLISLYLRGHLKAMLSTSAIIAAGITFASNLDNAQAFQSAQNGAFDVQLACVQTGRAQVDQKCLRGLTGLSLELRRRTSVWPGDPVFIRPNQDNLGLYPVLYWPILRDAPPLSDDEVSNISNYMRQAGLIIFDTGLEQEKRSFNPQDVEATRDALRRVVGRLDLPPLELLQGDHVLSHAFYILDQYPGRHIGHPTWVEQGTKGESGRVSTIIIGGNDWASPWAIENRPDPRAVPQFTGNRQQEIALRFGINMVIYALTGTYKSDQVHLPALIDRVGR